VCAGPTTAWAEITRRAPRYDRGVILRSGTHGNRNRRRPAWWPACLDGCGIDPTVIMAGSSTAMGLEHKVGAEKARLAMSSKGRKDARDYLAKPASACAIATQVSIPEPHGTITAPWHKLREAL